MIVSRSDYPLMMPRNWVSCERDNAFQSRSSDTVQPCTKSPFQSCPSIWLADASGCKNAAAGRPVQDDCAFTTYEASCERGRDPWGCVMLGHELLDGNAWRRDVERTRKVLPIACSRGEADPACQAARQVQNR